MKRNTIFEEFPKKQKIFLFINYCKFANLMKKFDLFTYTGFLILFIFNLKKNIFIKNAAYFIFYQFFAHKTLCRVNVE